MLPPSEGPSDLNFPAWQCQNSNNKCGQRGQITCGQESHAAADLCTGLDCGLPT